MKKILLILALIYSFAASAQLDTTKQIQTISVQGYAYKHLQAIYAMLFPTDTLHLKYDWRGIAFKGTSPYFWNGSFWSAFGTGGSGSADSTIYATLYRLDTAKANLRTAINLKLSITDTANVRPRLYAGSNVTITGTYPNLTISSSGGDTSTFVIDTLYNRLAKVVNVDSIRLKSLRVRLNGSDVAPTTTDSTISWDILSSAPGLPDSMAVIRSRYDSAHYTVVLLNDSTVVFRSFNGQDDTLQFHAGTGTDTTSLSNRINLKLNISDTANMRPRIYAGSNISISGTYPNLTISSTGTVTSVATGYGLSGGTITSSGTILVDSASLSSYYLRRKDSLTASNQLGYVTKTVLKDSLANIRALFVIDTTTIPLITFTAGAGFAADTAMVTDSSLFGSLFTGQYQYTIKQIQAVIKGNSGDSIVLKLVYNDTFNVDGTKINGAGLSLNNRHLGNSFTITTNRTIATNSWLWMKPEAVINGKKPKYISVTLLGYKTYVAP